MKFKLSIIAAFLVATFSCQNDLTSIPDVVSNVDSTSLELVWEKPLDSNFQKIQIYPFPIGENIIHTYDWYLSPTKFGQLLVYSNGKTGEEIKRINFNDLIFPPQTKVYEDKLVYTSAKSVTILDPIIEQFKRIYTTQENRLLFGDRFQMYKDLIVTNENTFQAGDSLDRIILANVRTGTGKTVYAVKQNTSRSYFFNNPQIWIDEVGDTILTVGRELINSGISPANLLSYNVSKDKVLFDLTFPYGTEKVAENFICSKNKIYLKKGVVGVTCVDGKTGKSIWSQTIYDARLGGPYMYLFDDKLIAYASVPNKRLLCFNADIGTLLWTNNDVPFIAHDISLLLIDNILYFGEGDYIYGIDKNTGSLLKKQRITNGKNHLISNISYSEKNKLIYAIDSNFIKALRIK
jgi:outer membrane protein assembly factor BamB